MILYRKAPHLRVRRVAAPEPPYWQATTLAPYGAKRAAPISIDYIDLRASFVEKSEVGVTDDVREELERGTQRSLGQPVLIDATEFAERVFRRGDELLRYCAEQGYATTCLVSTRGTLPEAIPLDGVTAICCWPLDLGRIEAMFAAAKKCGLQWGAAVPVIYPVTTSLAALSELADCAKRYGARFFAAITLEVDASARSAIAQSLALGDDDETYDILFHADLEPVHIATERHIAALAAEIGAADFILPPRWAAKSNWNGATLLTLTATRMMAMNHETELASTIARSARALAALEKPIERIAAAASLSIIDTLDEVSVDVLTEWLEKGTPAFARNIDELWRLRRDYGLNKGT